MKSLFVAALLATLGSATAFAQAPAAAPPPAPAPAPAAAPAPAPAATNASLVGNYVVTGTEADGAAYDGPGPLAITMDTSGALDLKWDDGKYVGVGHVVGNSLAVGSAAEGKVIVMIMSIKPDGSLEGKWWRRTDGGNKGTEVWKKK